MTQAVDQRLEDALRRRDELEAEKQRILGKLDSSKQALSEVEDACRKKGIDPEDLDSTITKLRGRYEEAVSTLEDKVSEAEEALMPFTGDVDED